MDLEETQLRDEIKRGPSKSPPNSFQIKNLAAKIRTFEQVDELWQAPNQNRFFNDILHTSTGVAIFRL